MAMLLLWSLPTLIYLLLRHQPAVAVCGLGRPWARGGVGSDDAARVAGAELPRVVACVGGGCRAGHDCNNGNGIPRDGAARGGRRNLLPRFPTRNYHPALECRRGNYSAGPPLRPHPPTAGHAGYQPHPALCFADCHRLRPGLAAREKRFSMARRRRARYHQRPHGSAPRVAHARD